MDSKNVQINTEVGFVTLETEVAQDTGFVGQRIVVEEGRPSQLDRSAWTVEEIVGRIWPLANGEIENAASGEGLYLIDKWDWPGKMQNEDGFSVWKLLSRFPLFNFDTTFILSVNSTISFGGHLVMSFDHFDCHRLNKMSEPKIGTSSWTNMKNVWMDLSKDADVELHIPFLNIMPYLTGRKNTDFSPRKLGILWLSRSGHIITPPESNITWQLSVKFTNVQTFGYGASINNVITDRANPEGIGMPSGMFNSAEPSKYLFGDRENQADLWGDEIIYRYSMHRVFTWSSETPRGSKIRRFGVHPFNLRLRQTGTNIVNLNTLSYMTLLFCAWQGDLRFKIVIGSTQMMTGRLLIVYDPYLTDGQSDVFNNYQNYTYEILDVKERHEYEFTVPFMMNIVRAPLHHKQLMHGNDVSSNGRINIYVLQPLRSAQGGNITVSGFVLVSPEKNFNMSISSLPPKYFNNGSASNSLSTERGDTVPPMAQREVLLGYQLPFPRASHRLSLHTLSQDFFEMGTYYTNLPCTHFVFPVTPILPLHPKLIPLYSGDLHPVTHISRCYALWRGTLKFKVVTESQDNRKESSLTVGHCVNTEFNNYGFSLDIMTNTNTQEIPMSADVNNLYEFDVPMRGFYEWFHLTHTQKNFPSQSKYNGYIILRWDTFFAGAIKIYCAAGGDFQLNGFVGGLDYWKPPDTLRPPTGRPPSTPSYEVDF